VPSLIVPQERNYVLNVAHPLFANVTVAGAEAFSFDERLWHAQG
jgi:RES domain-containing protein